MQDPDRDSPRSSWRGGLCERTGPSLYGGSCRIEQEDFPKKKKTLGGTLGNFPAATAPVSSPPNHPPICIPTEVWGYGDQIQSTGGGGSAHLGGPDTIGTNWEVCTATGECAHLISEGSETTGTIWGVCDETGQYTPPPGIERRD